MGADADTRVAGDRIGLERLYVLCLPALGSFHDVELHGLAFLQAAKALGLDGRKMNEYIFAILPADKAVALGVVKPLNCSLLHTCCTLPCFDFALGDEPEGTARQITLYSGMLLQPPLPSEAISVYRN